MRNATDAEIAEARAKPDSDSVLGIRNDADERDGAHYGRLVVHGAHDSIEGRSTATSANVFRTIWRRHPKIVPALT
eukprot:SAG31_NODE_25493_length_460_cov_0.731302_1_plen_76_part_00